MYDYEQVEKSLMIKCPVLIGAMIFTLHLKRKCLINKSLFTQTGEQDCSAHCAHFNTVRDTVIIKPLRSSASGSALLTAMNRHLQGEKKSCAEIQ